ncbi:hypothetical protein [Candidatus Uabimicrobium sp. HlEnr_7]|uniref:hypothetical protein n=1 Tax=Candidatus Uabimicrobium helgolandensis TaxID=3095367 RepID=UPI003558E476
MEYWSLREVEEEFEDPMDCDEFREALDFHSDLIQFFIDFEASDDIDLVKLRQDITEKFPQERVENTRVTFKKYSSVS